MPTLSLFNDPRIENGTLTSYWCLLWMSSLAHIPRVCQALCTDSRYRPVMLMISTRPVVLHEQKAHGLTVLVGMVNRCGYNGQQKMLFVTFVDHAKQFEAHSSQFFTEFN